MRIAIHVQSGSFSDRWIAYCNEKGIGYKPVNCFANDILAQLTDCNAIHFAKQLLYSLEKKGIKVFPDFNTVCHFDDKLGQKYLLESIGAPTPETWIFYNKSEALQWASETCYPKVFKLRKGAGSQNVRLARNKE